MGGLIIKRNSIKEKIPTGNEIPFDIRFTLQPEIRTETQFYQSLINEKNVFAYTLMPASNLIFCCENDDSHIGIIDPFTQKISKTMYMEEFLMSMMREEENLFNGISIASQNFSRIFSDFEFSRKGKRIEDILSYNTSPISELEVLRSFASTNDFRRFYLTLGYFDKNEFSKSNPNSGRILKNLQTTVLKDLHNTMIKVKEKDIKKFTEKKQKKEIKEKELGHSIEDEDNKLSKKEPVKKITLRQLFSRKNPFELLYNLSEEGEITPILSKK